MDVECNLKYGVIRRCTPVVVKNLAEISELQTCVDEDSLLQRGANSFLAKNSAHAYNITTTYDKVTSLDQLNMQEINSVISSPIDNMPLVENVVNFEVEGYSSDYEEEEAINGFSIDEGKIVDPTYYEEASCDDNDESGCLSQEEDNASTYSSSC